MRIKIDKEWDYGEPEYYIKIYFKDWQIQIYNPFTSAFEFIQYGDADFQEVIVTRFWFIYIIYFGEEK